VLRAAYNVLPKGIQMKIDSDYIKLDSFLKAVNAVASGGEAKLLIADGEVRVNGGVELRRGRKLYPGDRVTMNGEEFFVE
jgi:ribosome-associated protein